MEDIIGSLLKGLGVELEDEDAQPMLAERRQRRQRQRQRRRDDERDEDFDDDDAYETEEEEEEFDDDEEGDDEEEGDEEEDVAKRRRRRGKPPLFVLLKTAATPAYLQGLIIVNTVEKYQFPIPFRYMFATEQLLFAEAEQLSIENTQHALRAYRQRAANIVFDESEGKQSELARRLQGLLVNEQAGGREGREVRGGAVFEYVDPEKRERGEYNNNTYITPDVTVSIPEIDRGDGDGDGDGDAAAAPPGVRRGFFHINYATRTADGGEEEGEEGEEKGDEEDDLYADDDAYATSRASAQALRKVVYFKMNEEDGSMQYFRDQDDYHVFEPGELQELFDRVARAKLDVKTAGRVQLAIPRRQEPSEEEEDEDEDEEERTYEAEEEEEVLSLRRKNKHRGVYTTAYMCPWLADLHLRQSLFEDNYVAHSYMLRFAQVYWQTKRDIASGLWLEVPDMDEDQDGSFQWLQSFMEREVLDASPDVTRLFIASADSGKTAGAEDSRFEYQINVKVDDHDKLKPQCFYCPSGNRYFFPAIVESTNPDDSGEMDISYRYYRKNNNNNKAVAVEVVAAQKVPRSKLVFVLTREETNNQLKLKQLPIKTDTTVYDAYKECVDCMCRATANEDIIGVGTFVRTPICFRDGGGVGGGGVGGGGGDMYIAADDNKYHQNTIFAVRD